MTQWAPSGIETCDIAWNPYRGCTRGCPHCWARATCRLHAKVFAKIEVDDVSPGWWNSRTNKDKKLCFDYYKEKFENFEFTVVPSQWRKLLRYHPKESKRIFVGSQTDISTLPLSELLRLKVAIENNNKWRSITNLPLHQFQFLTQDPLVYEKMMNFPLNCWLGFTAKVQKEYDRRREILSNLLKNDIVRASREEVKLKARRKWYAYIEPLIQEIDIRDYVSGNPRWIVVGGMSRQNGVKPVPMEAHWVRKIRDRAQINCIPFFFKGWGAIIPPGQEKGKLDGEEYHEFPPSVEVA